jgi:predicted dehydrogenase
MNKPIVNVALIGSGFMGRAHSNGLRQVKSFFELPVEPVMKALVGRNEKTGSKVLDAFGWEELVKDWREVIDRKDIDLIDIATPVHTHSEIAIAALEAGKAVICEKPLAFNLEEAIQMAKAAEKSGAMNMCNYNMRAVPAIALAKQFIRSGRIGEVNQWRSAFLQSWLVDENFPLTWRLQKEFAGSGALGDLGSHSLDMARYLVGEIESVTSMMNTFTKQRYKPLADVGRNSKPSDELGEVTVDDSVWSLLRFENQVFGSMEATRMATGQLCSNRFEVFGSRGGLSFDFMRMNELEFFSNTDVDQEQGWRKIHVTHPTHPYISAWWPKGHSLGYEHSFPNLYADFFRAYAGDENEIPTIRDAAKTQAVMHAVEVSAGMGEWVRVPSI